MGGFSFERISQSINYPVHALINTSPRKILFAFNIVLIICSTVIAGFSLFLVRLLYDKDFTTGWINWFGLSVVGLSLIITAGIGLRGAHLVSLELLLTYFWGIIVFIVPLVLGLFACFNFLAYTRIWFKHAWTLQNFAEVRKLFCFPHDTAETKCKAPIDSVIVSPIYVNNVTTWCIKNWNATDCESIRNKAVASAVKWGSTLIIIQTTVGVIGLFFISGSIYISYQILTSPVITQSMLDVINYFLAFPIAGCIGLAAYFWWIESLDIAYGWLPKLYLALALAQVLALPIGIVAGRQKSRTLLKCYIVLAVVITGGLALAGFFGWALAKNFSLNFEPSSEEVASIACRRGLSGCSHCDQLTNRCPEWSKFEVVTLLSIDMRLAGMVCIVSTLYLLGALIVALLVNHNLKNYKTDFI